MQHNSLFQKVCRLVFLLVLVNVIGYIASGYMTPETLKWYHALPQSKLTPPDALFGVVWSLLFTLQAISAFLVWGKVTPRYFALQLALNMLWSFCFFYLRSPLAAFFTLILFTLAVIATIKSFYKASKVASWLMLPTLLWALFAMYLNVMILL